MPNAFAVAAENPAALAFGAAGLACQLAWPVFASRRSMLCVQIGIGANYGAQYALLGAWTGAGICALGATQTFVALLAGARSGVRRVAAGFALLVIAACLATWSGPASLCAMAACLLVMTARLHRDTIRLRSYMLAASPFGIAYDVLVGAPPALVGACISAGAGSVMLVREIRARGCAHRHTSARKPQLAAQS